MVRKDAAGAAVEQLRAFGLRYPGAHTKSPWPGHLDLAVNDKTFAYLSLAGEPLTISCKLPRSADSALSLPFTTPTAYGLGKSGWVTATFPDDAPVPVELLQEWIDESYRAQAPKRLSAGLPARGSDMAVEAAPEAVGRAPRRVERSAAAPRVERSATAPRRSTVKQKASPSASASRAPAGARSAKRRPARTKMQSVATRAKKRATVRQQAAPAAAPRTPKKRRRSPA
jgi:predicted DNA-binding protein (MmcQ/YjbR family)